MESTNTHSFVEHFQLKNAENYLITSRYKEITFGFKNSNEFS